MAMLRAVANPIEDKRQILHQIIISRNAKLNSLHITLLVASSCIGVGLAVHTPFQPTVTPTVELIPSSYPNVLVRVITDRVRLIKCMNRASLYLFSPRVDVVVFHLVKRRWMQQLQFGLTLALVIQTGSWTGVCKVSRVCHWY